MAVILRIAFGYQVTSNEDVYLDMARAASHALETTGSPGGTPVDFFPFRMYNFRITTPSST